MSQKDQTMNIRPRELSVLLLGLILFSACLHTLSQRPISSTYEQSEAYLKNLRKQDITQIANTLKRANLERQLANAASMEEKMKIRFGNAVILGDSIVEGLSDYRLLEPTQAIFARGRRTDNCTEDLERAAKLAPEVVFLNYGMNDLEYCRGDAKRYIAQYEGVVKQVRELMPQATIYINAILPIDASAKARVKAYAQVDPFNRALADFCRQQGIKLINSSSLIQGKQDYEFDGVHPKYAFYPLWLKHMLEEAGR